MNNIQVSHNYMSKAYLHTIVIVLFYLIKIVKLKVWPVCLLLQQRLKLPHSSSKCQFLPSLLPPWTSLPSTAFLSCFPFSTFLIIAFSFLISLFMYDTVVSFFQHSRWLCLYNFNLQSFEIFHVFLLWTYWISDHTVAFQMFVLLHGEK